MNLQQNELALLRTQHGFSQKQLAALIGNNRGAISMYENGHALPTLASAGMFQLIFGKNVAEIFPALFRRLQAELEQNRSKLQPSMPRKAQQA